MSKLFAVWAVIALFLSAEVYGEIIRDPDGRIHRSKMAVQHFREDHPCPATGKPGMGRCGGYVVDHIVPLCAGGDDLPSNMQWQDAATSKKKDESERQLCSGKITIDSFKTLWNIDK